jgi:hypothetical protein
MGTETGWRRIENRRHQIQNGPSDMAFITGIGTPNRRNKQP